jgi:hypothetical protein
MTPALVASFSTTLPAIADACGRCDAAFGDQQNAEHADQQDGGLKEQGGGVDGDGTGHRRSARAALEVPGQSDDRHQRGEQPADAEHQLRGITPLARQECLDEHTGDGHPENDQHGGEQAVFDAGGR